MSEDDADNKSEREWEIFRTVVVALLIILGAALVFGCLLYGALVTGM